MTNTTTKRVRIVRDSDPCNPREWDNIGTIAIWHRRYAFGDVHPDESNTEYLRGLAVAACPRLEEILYYWDNEGFVAIEERHGTDEALRETGRICDELIGAVIEKHYVIKTLYLYDHSGLSLSTSPFSCPWDSGPVGYIYCSIDKARESQLLDESADWGTPVSHPDYPTLLAVTEHNLECEVKTLDAYLSGEVYGFVVEEEGEDGEFFEVDSCWSFYGSDPFENGMSGHLDEELHDLLREAT